MMIRTIGLAVILGVLALPGVAAAAGEPPRACGDADERISPQRSDPFFTLLHRPRGSFTLSTGEVVPIPFPVYQADASMIYGLVDASVVRGIMAGTGHKPVTTKGRAIARLFIWELDTALGPYEEIALIFDSSREAIEVPWVNPYSSFTPGLDPRATYFMHRLILDRWPSIHFGREFLGFDKTFGCIDIERTGNAVTGTTRTFAFRDSEGRPVLSGRLNEPDIAASTVLAPHRLAEALGIDSPVHLPSLDVEAVIGGVSRDVMDGGRTLKYHVVNAKFSGVVTEFDGELKVGRASPMGRQLAQLGFEPTVVFRAPNFMFVMDRAPDGTPLLP
jgi:hypothetical protein